MMDVMDNQSTVKIFYNEKLLTNTHEVKEINVHSNAGISTAKLMGLPDNYGWVYFDPQGLQTS